MANRITRWALVAGMLALALSGCGAVSHQTARSTGRPPSGQVHAASSSSSAPYQWPSLSTYSSFAGSVSLSDGCKLSTQQLEASAASAAKIAECWQGNVSGHSFVYVAFYAPNKQGYQVTVNGTTHTQDTNGIPLLYQFSGSYACTGSGAAAWMWAIDLATGRSYDPSSGGAQSHMVNRHCASPNNPGVIAAKYVIGIPGHVPMQRH